MEGCGRRRGLDYLARAVNCGCGQCEKKACLLAGAAVVMAGGIGVGFVLGLLYASQRRRPVPATLYRVASKEVDAKGLADLALAEVV